MAAKLNTAALAVLGIPQKPRIGKLRVAAAASAGPPVTPVGEVRECERVEIRGVVAGEDHGAARWDEVRALDRPSHPVVQRWE